MKLLVTSARLPFGLDLIRKLSEAGHDVYASDTYREAPGSHSRYLSGHFVTAKPAQETERFLEDVERIVRENEIEMVVPSFEEAFFLSTRHAELSEITRLYTPPFRTLAPLHDKSTFQQLMDKLDLRTPETVVAKSDQELREALERWPRYFARAAFSRGGVALLTNTGPLAGHVQVEDCHPTEASPWLMQEFVDGPMVCSYSTIHDSRITAHGTYRAPRQWEHSTGIQFLAVDSAETLAAARKIAEEVEYTGQMSLDFVDSDGQLYMIECNPRPTDGVLLMSSEQVAGGITDPGRELQVVEPGQEVQLDLAVFGQIFKEGIKEMPRSIHDLVAIRGSDRGWHDLLPTLYSFLAFGRSATISRREHQALFVAMSDDITWDGEPIEGLKPEDQAVLDGLVSDRT
jgi:hypothetical protein